MARVNESNEQTLLQTRGEVNQSAHSRARGEKCISTLVEGLSRTAASSDVITPNIVFIILGCTFLLFSRHPSYARFFFSPSSLALGLLHTSKSKFGHVRYVNGRGVGAFMFMHCQHVEIRKFSRGKPYIHHSSIIIQN